MQGLKMQVVALQEEVRKQQQQLQRLEVEKEGYNKEAMDTKHRCIEQVRTQNLYRQSLALLEGGQEMCIHFMHYVYAMLMCDTYTADGRSKEERDGVVSTKEESSRVREQTQAAKCMQ